MRAVAFRIYAAAPGAPRSINSARSIVRCRGALWTVNGDGRQKRTCSYVGCTKGYVPVSWDFLGSTPLRSKSPDRQAKETLETSGS